MGTTSKRIPKWANYFHTQTAIPINLLQMKVQPNTLVFNGEPEYVRKLFNLMWYEGSDLLITLRQCGNRSIIVDNDTLLNKKWRNIWR